MIQLQIISKIIQTGDASILFDNLINDDEHFVGYTDELHFIQDHLKQYGNVPDKATFLAQFPDIELVEVTESDRYLVDTVREEYLYYKSVPVIQKAAELLKTDSNAASEYLVNAMKELQPSYHLGGIDIAAEAKTRYEEFLDRKQNQDKWFFTCGFPELDDLIHGIKRKEEFFVIFARTNQGKSWILEKICTHVWQTGYNVGYISPEMSASSIGYRFDTLHSHFSNSGLTWGKDDIDEAEYEDYIDEISKANNKFVVSTPLDFDKKITVTKVKNWIKQNKLDMVAIDGITYLTDERFKRGDNTTRSLTNISEDLMELSIEMEVPVLVVVQSNRGGVVERGTDSTPELENIRDSDGIAHNASKVLSINQKESGILVMSVKKNRYGSVGGKLTYNWDINTGNFTWIPSTDDAVNETTRNNKVDELKKSFKDSADVF